jgi:hypothetical protein
VGERLNNNNQQNRSTASHANASGFLFSYSGVKVYPWSVWSTPVRVPPLSLKLRTFTWIMIHDEERHADFLEAQLHPIKEMGIGVYLAQQLQGR